MTPFGEPSREQYLQQQKASSFPGVVTYQRGLDFKAASGFVLLGVAWVMVFPDSNSLVSEQKRIIIPREHVVEVVADGED